MRRLAASVGKTISGGRVISLWTIALTLPLCLTVMSATPLRAFDVGWLVATLLAWSCFAVALGALGLIERRIDRPVARATTIATGVVVVGACRPVVQDGWMAVLDAPVAAIGPLSFRIATNIAVWTVVIVVAAMIVTTLRSLRETNALLRGLVDELQHAHVRDRDFEVGARSLVQRAIAELRRSARNIGSSADALARIEQLASDGLRSWSHTLASASDSALELPAPVRPSVEDDTGRRWRFVVRLPPIGLVPMLYVVCVLPYALRTAATSEIVIGLGVIVVCGAVADAAPRRRRLVPRAVASPVVFLVLSVIVGVVLAGSAMESGTPAVVATVPLVVYPLLAFASGWGAGLLHTLRAEEQRLSRSVSAYAHATHRGTQSARDALREAAAILHRDGQGACLVFVLTHSSPTRAEAGAFTARLTEIIDGLADVFDRAPPHIDLASVDLLLSTWSRAMDLETCIAPQARKALDERPDVARDTFDIIAEGLLNAAKHSGTRRAGVEMDVVATGAGRCLRVRVRSFGAMPIKTVLHERSDARILGARLLARPEGALLEATLVLETPRTVVSAEHPHRHDRHRP